MLHRVSYLLAAFAMGALFTVGLAVAGMTLPERIVGFLDVTGAAGSWNPTLAVTLGAAVATYFVVSRLAWRREAPVLDTRFRVPTRRDITVRLVAGSALFGAGWGLAGYCPGPALAALSTAAPKAFVFVAAMISGMLLYMPFDRSLTRGWIHRLVTGARTRSAGRSETRARASTHAAS